MADALESVFDVNRRRSEAEWRVVLEALAGALSGLLQRDVVIAGVSAEDDNDGYASWGATAYIRILLSRLPLLEWSGTISVTVNVGEIVMISSDLLLFADGIRIRGPAGGDLFHLAFTEDQAWVSRGWMPDENGEWEAETTLSPQAPSEA
jgi:hypothetical protein